MMVSVIGKPMSRVTDNIAGNYYTYSKLVEWIRRGQAIAFVGAGASIELYGGWGELIEALITAAISRVGVSDGETTFWRKHAPRRPQNIVRAIKRSFGEDRAFNEILTNYFKPKLHYKTAKTYTPVHKAIIELPFQGIVTTNYDNCLLDAQQDCRPDIKPQYGTWKDEATVTDWHTRDISENHRCPLLYAHGIWNRPDTIILDNDTYREAYKDGNYLRMFQELWRSQHLVLVGVGFSDSWVDRVIDDILTYVVHSGSVRHIAILGIREKDLDQVRSLRDLMQNAYNAYVYFYIINEQVIGDKIQEDHSQLLDLLLQLRASVIPEESVDRSLRPLPESFPFNSSDLSCAKPEHVTHEKDMRSGTSSKGKIEPTASSAKSSKKGTSGRRPSRSRGASGR
jgi:hypothetical protein